MSDFKPTPGMVRYAQVYCDTSSRKMSLQEMADKVGISRMQAYRWRRDPEFKKWLQEKVDQALDDSVNELILHGIKEAKKSGPGAFQYWRTLLELTGRYVPNLRLETAIEPPRIQFILNKTEEIIEGEKVKEIEGGPNETD